MFVPVVIAVYAAITFYVDRGVLAALLHVVGIPYVSPAYKPGGVVLTQVWFNIPFAVLMLGSGLDGIEQELIELGHGQMIVPLVADILDAVRLREVFSRFHPAVVFHAAA